MTFLCRETRQLIVVLQESNVLQHFLTSDLVSLGLWGNVMAKNMRVKKIEYLPAYHYELQTFTEKRETAW